MERRTRYRRSANWRRPSYVRLCWYAYWKDFMAREQQAKWTFSSDA